MKPKDTGELFDLLTESHRAEHEKLVKTFSNLDNERTSILTAHLIAERFLEGMIETILQRPTVWLKDADYLSKAKLAYAHGLIGDHEFLCCKVLNRCRNAIAHNLEPLPDKWRAELDRLSKKVGESARWKDVKPGLRKSLYVLLATISHAWVHAKFDYNWKQLRKLHGDRWAALYVEKMKQHKVLDEIDFSHEVDLELAKEVRQQIKNAEKK